MERQEFTSLSASGILCVHFLVECRDYCVSGTWKKASRVIWQY